MAHSRAQINFEPKIAPFANFPSNKSASSKTNSDAAAAAYLASLNNALESLSNPSDSSQDLNVLSDSINTAASAQTAQPYNLNAFKTDPFKEGIIAATSAYIASTITANANQTNNMLQTSKIENDLMTTFTQIAQAASALIGQEITEYNEEQNSADFLSQVVSYVSGAVMLAIGFCTGDPAMIFFGALTIGMQASGARDKLEAALPSDPGMRALCEFGIAVGEALAAGGITALDEGLASVAEDVIVNAATKPSFLTSFATKFLANLGQTMMMNNVWGDLMTKAKLTGTDAAACSILLGLAFCVGSSVVAAQFSGEGAFAQLIKGGFLKKFGENGEKYLNIFLTAIKIFRSAMQLSAAGTQIAESQFLQAAADILKNQATTQKEFVLVQALVDIINQAVDQTQSSNSAINQNNIVLSQTFPALAQMFAQQNNV